MPIPVANARRRELRALIAVCLVVAVGPGAAAVALADSLEPEDEMTVSVEQTAYWTTPAVNTLPETFTNEFPPGVVCILVPEFCTEDAQSVTSPVDEGLGGVQEEAQPEEVQPVPPDSLPVGVMFGEQRYAFGIQFDTPELPEGQDPGLVELVLPVETEPFGFESELFREVVAAAVAQAANDPSPEPFIDVLADTAAGDTEVLEQLEVPDIAVCAPVEPWDAGHNQDAEELPDTDNCFLGGDGAPTEDGEAWVFDITGAVAAWLEDDEAFHEDNNGILVVPGPVAPLDYGDPDYTTNFLGAFVEPSEVDLRFATVEGFDDVASDDFAEDDFAEDDFAEDDFEDEGFSDDPGVQEGGFDDFDDEPVESFAADADAPATEEEAPDVAGAGPDAQPQEQPNAAGRETAGGADPSELPWYTWLLLPVAAGGAWWFGRIHDVELPAEAAPVDSDQGGAMSRLVQRVRSG